MIRSQDPFGIFVCLIHCRKVLKKMQSAFCSHYFIFQQMDIFGHTDMKGINGWWPKELFVTWFESSDAHPVRASTKGGKEGNNS